MDKTLLETFWLLAEGNDDKRISAASKLVEIIKLRQSESQPCKELVYTIDRLIKGLASSRKWARLGYATALTQILRHFHSIEVSDVITKIKEHLKVTPSVSKSEKSNLLLGRIMAYLSLIQSDLILKANADEIKFITQDILQIKEDRVPLHQICTQVFVTLLSKVSEEYFSEQMWPLLEKELSCGWDNCTPDAMWLLLVARKHHHKKLNHNFMLSYWKSKHVFNEKNYEAMARVIKTSTAEHPIVHHVCMELLHKAANKQDHFTAFWKEVLYDKVFPCGVSCAYLVFQLIPEALKLVSTPDEVYVVLSSSLVHFLIKNISNKQCALHSAAKLLNQSLIATCKTLAPSLQVAVVMSLVTSFDNASFHGGTVARATQTMLSDFSVDAVKELSSILMDNIKGKYITRPDISQDNLKTSELIVQQKWSVLTLSHLINQGTVSTDLCWCTSVAKFLFSLSFFGVEKAETGSIMHKQHLNPEVRHHTSSAVFRVLDRISKSLSKSMKGFCAYTDCLYDIVHCAKLLLSHSDAVENNKALDDRALESWQKMIIVTDKIKKKLEKVTVDQNDQLAFQLLFLHHGLQLFTEPISASEVLLELHTCYEKATVKKRRQSIAKQAQDEPEWIDVIIDLLLSLLSQQSHLVRTIVKTVFTMICSHLTRQSLQLVLEIFKPCSSDDDDDELLQFEDDSSKEDDEMVEDMDQSDDSTELTDSEESDEEGSDRNPVDENFVNSVKSALGSGAADTSDEESGEDLDDEAMFKLDDALAAAFKGMSRDKKQEADRKTQLQHYKMRCLEVLEVIVNHCSSSGVLLDLLIPLLSLMNAGVRNTTEKDLGDRAHKVFSQLVHVRKFSHDPSLERTELPEMVQSLVEYSSKVSGVPMIQNTAVACAFVIRIISSVEKLTRPSPIKTRAMAATKNQATSNQDTDNLDMVLCMIEKALKDFCLRRDSQVNHYFFLTLLEREPILFWPLAETIFEQIISDDVRIFCRTQCCAMLTLLITRSSIEALEPGVWNEFAGRMTKKVIQLIKNGVKQVLKPRYLHELLVLLHKIFTVLDKCTLQSLVTEDMLNEINTLRGCVSSDTRHVINKICGYCRSRTNRKTKAEKKQKEKQKEEDVGETMSTSEIQNGVCEDEQSSDNKSSHFTEVMTSQNGETPKKQETDENGSSKERGRNCRKKRRNSDTMVNAERKSELMKDKKKKRKSLAVTQDVD